MTRSTIQCPACGTLTTWSGHTLACQTCALVIPAIESIPVLPIRASESAEVIRGLSASHAFNLEAGDGDHIAYTHHTVETCRLIRGILNERRGFSGTSEGAQSLLDVGGGRGELAALLSCDFRTTMIDVDLGSALIAQRTRCWGTDTEVLCGDCSRLPFASGTFDVVVAKETAHHMKDVPAFFGEMRRVLRDQGIMVVVEGTVSRMANRAKATARDRMRQLGATHHHFTLEDVVNPLRAIFESVQVARMIPRVASRFVGGRSGFAIDARWKLLPNAIAEAVGAWSGGLAIVVSQHKRALPAGGGFPSSECVPYPVDLANREELSVSAVAEIDRVIRSEIGAAGRRGWPAREGAA